MMLWESCVHIIVAPATIMCYTVPSEEEVNYNMDVHFPSLARCISILDRLMRMYYDRELSDFEIGWGQQFYVEYIHDHPGTSAQEMVECIRVDKATLTKSIKKLVEIGYVSVVGDEEDKRVHHHYLTQKGVPAAMRIKEIHHSFYLALCSGISPSSIQMTEQTMEQMVENLNQKVWHRMEE